MSERVPPANRTQRPCVARPVTDARNNSGRRRCRGPPHARVVGDRPPLQRGGLARLGGGPGRAGHHAVVGPAVREYHSRQPNPVRSTKSSLLPGLPWAGLPWAGLGWAVPGPQQEIRREP